MKKVAVGSENPVKLEAVEKAFSQVFPNEIWQVEGVHVSSGVSDQPMSDVECIEGATNRARGARDTQDADFGVGIESGLQEVNGDYFEAGWVVILDQKGKMGIGSSIRIMVPEKMVELVRKGHEVGEVNDMLFDLENSKQGDGHFGLMTGGAITRMHGLRDGVISALALFINPQLDE
ncbi:inosine/xanthosine triphosphatase [Candidatus Kaiserbacteria bacterium]|nr:inosine/xanthosine triphosphatase [Candidatus Kaiserbacteria bacterium]